MKNLAIIPARSGSKGLPDKNIKDLCGKPLIAYSIQAAIRSGVFDTVMVSTDSEQYAQIAKTAGAEIPFLRSAATASDSAGTWDAVLEVLTQYQAQGITFDTVTVLQPTTPLRIAADITNAYAVYCDKHAKTVVSVCECEHSPLWCNTLPDTLNMDGFISADNNKRRQECGTFYRLNGAIYMIDVPTLQQQGKLLYDRDCYAAVMPVSRSVDIDTAVDFAIAKAIMENGEN